MSINLAGIAIDNNFAKDLHQLGEAFEWAVEEIEEIQFGSALSIFFSAEKDVFHVYFTDGGTLIFTPYEWAMEKFHSIDSNSMCFAYAESSMTFLFSYQDENSNYREFMENDGQKQSELGEPLRIEKQYPNASGLIFKMMEDLTGVNFHSIDHRAVVYKCRKLSRKDYHSKSEERLKNEMEITKREDDEKIEKYLQELGLDPKLVETQLNKKWWQFWK